MNSVRISSGKYRGMVLQTPGVGTHPMGAREKLALLNIINDFLPGAKVLDAYAGSGALGIEALSRGASEVVFIEKSPKAAKIIRKNLQNIGVDSEVLTQNVINFTTDDRFGVILADPPYDDFELTGVEHLTQFLDTGGVLVLSHPGEVPELPGMALKKSRKYAGATISVYLR